MIYLLYFFLLVTIGLVITGNVKVKKSYYLIYYLAIVLFWGLSYYDAVDTLGYIQKFYVDIETLGGHIDRQFEIGYTFSAMLCKTILPYYWFYQLVVFAIELKLILSGLRKLIDEKMLMFLIPLLFFVYPLNLAAFRQGMATSLFIFAIPYINAEKFRKSLLFFAFIILASFFHQSAFMLAVVYLARYTEKLMNKSWIVFSVLVIGDLLWLTGTSLIPQLDFLLPFFAGDTLDMGDKYANYIESVNTNGTYGITKVIEINFTVIAYSLLCKKEKGYSLMSFNMMLYVFIGLVLGGMLAHRLNYYWTLLYYACFIQSVISLFKSSKTQIIGYILVAVYMIYYYIFKIHYLDMDYQFLFNY